MKRLLASYGTDILFVVGLGLVAWALGSIYSPLAPATVGTAFMALAVVAARRKPEER